MEIAYFSVSYITKCTFPMNLEDSCVFLTSVLVMKISENEWKLKLGPEQYKVLRQCGTEAPFTGKYVHHKDDGVYVCAGCGNELFSSDTKYESGSGWPAFWKIFSEDSVDTKLDTSDGMKRIEVTCKKCGGHLGHVF